MVYKIIPRMQYLRNCLVMSEFYNPERQEHKIFLILQHLLAGILVMPFAHEEVCKHPYCGSSRAIHHPGLQRHGATETALQAEPRR